MVSVIMMNQNKWVKWGENEERGYLEVTQKIPKWEKKTVRS